jgi:hypothetical protein
MKYGVTSSTMWNGQVIITVFPITSNKYRFSALGAFKMHSNSSFEIYNYFLEILVTLLCFTNFEVIPPI